MFPLQRSLPLTSSFWSRLAPELLLSLLEQVFSSPFLKKKIEPDVSELDSLVKSVNGILFTGGGLSLLPNTSYFATAKVLFGKKRN